MDLKELVDLGVKMGYKEKELQDFVANERAKQEILVNKDREREERRIEREIKREQDAREHEKDVLKMQLDLQKAKSENPGGAEWGPKPTSSKLAPFDEGKDNIDAYICRFERLAAHKKWPKATWSDNLSALLKGKELDVYSRLSAEEALDYDKLTTALRKCYQLTEEGFRLKFRTCRPERGEGPVQFAARISGYLERWIDLSNMKKDYESLVDLMLREQFSLSCNKELSVFLKERKCTSIDSMAEAAERYTEAHGINSFLSSSGLKHGNGSGKGSKIYHTDQRRNDSSSANSYGKTNNSASSFSGKTTTASGKCYNCDGFGHLARNCPSSRRKPEKTKVATAKCSQNAECVNKCKPINKCLHCSHECSYVSSCSLEQSKDIEQSRDKIGMVSRQFVESCDPTTKKRPMTRGLVSGQPVMVLRDTGCDTAVVHQSLVQPDQMTNRTQEVQLMDGTLRKYPTANVFLDSSYYTGNVETIVMDNPVYDCVIGNLQGARDAYDPDPNWTPKLDDANSVKCSISDSNIVGSVETRSMVQNKSKPVKPLKILDTISEVKPADLAKAQQEDVSISHLWKKARNQDISGKYKFIIRDGWLLRAPSKDTDTKGNTQLVVPKDYRDRVMKIAHDGLMSGHQGITKTTDKILTQFYWPGLGEDVRHYCRSCDICQRTIQKGKITKVPLGKMPIIDVPFQRIAMDLVGPISPVSDRGKRYILTIVDYATRYPEAVALSTIDTETVSEALLDIYSRVGVPKEVLTDMGTQFTSEVMKEVGRLLSLKQMTSTPYHPICNGLVEKFNGTLKLMLKRLCAERPKDWDRYINSLLFAYREAPQESTGFSPFEILYGRKVRGPLTILRELWTSDKDNPEVRSTYQYVIDLKEKLSTTCEMVQQALEKSSKRYKRYYDAKAKPRSLQIGDKVLILLPTDNNKLLMQWKGPYPVPWFKTSLNQ